MAAAESVLNMSLAAILARLAALLYEVKGTNLTLPLSGFSTSFLICGPKFGPPLPLVETMITETSWPRAAAGTPASPAASNNRKVLAVISPPQVAPLYRGVGGK